MMLIDVFGRLPWPNVGAHTVSRKFLGKCIYILIYSAVYVCMYACMYVYMYECVHACSVHVCMCACMHMYMHKYTIYRYILQCIRFE